MNFFPTRLQYNNISKLDKLTQSKNSNSKKKKEEEITILNDKRTKKDFSKATFSNFKKTDVKRELIKCLFNQNIENSCYWTAEMISSGYILDCWNIFLQFMAKYIHIANPKICIYLEKRFQSFRDIIIQKCGGDELLVRNEPKARKIFCEIPVILCMAPRRNAFNEIKFKENDFQVEEMSKHLKATSMEFIQKYFKNEDPKELFIPLNEFVYQLQKSNSYMSCFWFEWILGFETYCKKKKKINLDGRTRNMDVGDKLQKDIVWLIWEIIQSFSKRKGTMPYTDALQKLFSIHYSKGEKKKRKFLIYYAIYLLTDNPDLHTPLIEKKEVVDKIHKKYDLLYQEIKKNEIVPDEKGNYIMENVIIPKK